MKKSAVAILSILCAVLFLAGATTSLAADQLVKKIKEIPDPAIGNPVVGFDISWADNSGTYYLADLNTSAPGVSGTLTGPGRVDYFNANTDTFEGYISGFTGQVAVTPDPAEDPFNLRKSGPSGIVVVPGYPNFGTKELWVADGDSTVKVVDLSTKKIVASISTGGIFHCDELSYDPIDHIIMVTNNMENVENSGKFDFATFIDQKTRTVLGKIVFDGTSLAAPFTPGHGPNTPAGLEQSVYDAPYFYLSVPATADYPNGGEIDVINPLTMTIVHRYFVDGLQASGVALGPFHHLVIGGGGNSTIIMNDRDGSIVANIDSVYNSDEVWYNPTDMRYYIAAGAPGIMPAAAAPVGVLGVIDAITNRWLQNIPTVIGAHSVAVNPLNNHIYVPDSTDGGGIINVYVPADGNGVFNICTVCQHGHWTYGH